MCYLERDTLLVRVVGLGPQHLHVIDTVRVVVINKYCLFGKIYCSNLVYYPYYRNIFCVICI